MVTRRSFLLASLVPGLAPLGAIAPLQAAPERSTLVVVTRRASTLTQVSLRDLKWMYTGEQVNAPEGGTLIPFNHVAGSAARVAFDRLVLQMTPDEVGRYWVDRKIRGQTGAPRSVPSVELLRRVLLAMPNSVTYLYAADVIADLKVLSVDGKSPTDPAYPLHVAV